MHCAEGLVGAQPCIGIAVAVAVAVAGSGAFVASEGTLFWAWMCYFSLLFLIFIFSDILVIIVNVWNHIQSLWVCLMCYS